MTTTYGILSTYPPTQCGLATFSAALARRWHPPTDVVEIVAVADAPGETWRRGSGPRWVKR